MTRYRVLLVKKTKDGWITIGDETKSNIHTIVPFILLNTGIGENGLVWQLLLGKQNADGFRIFEHDNKTFYVKLEKIT